MQVRIREGYIGQAGNTPNSEAFKKFFKDNAGKFVEVDTLFMFNNQYNVQGFRIYDGHIDAVRNDLRGEYHRCKWCGSQMKLNITCGRSPECETYGMARLEGFFTKYNNQEVPWQHLDFKGKDEIRLGDSRWTIRHLPDSPHFYWLHGNGSFAIMLAFVEGKVYRVDIGYYELKKGRKDTFVPKYIVDLLYKLEKAD